MGIEDRDYYREHARSRDASPHSKLKPRSASSSSPRRHDWHWSVIALFWTFILIVIAAAFRFLR